MKRLSLLLALPALLHSPATAAPIPITGAGLVYQQNFNSLAIAANNGNSVTAWADDSTLPGWWLFRAGNGTPTTLPNFVGGAYTYIVSDGTVTIGGGNFMSLGAAGSNERALGNPSTTGQGELSAIVVFQNTSALTVEVTNISHNVEVRRCNQNANLLESLFVWSRTGATLAEIQTMTTAVATAADFPATVASTPGSHYITGWNRHAEAEVAYTGGAAYAPVNESIPVDVTPATRTFIAPGQFFAIRYSNLNDVGTDHQMGVDDVALTFTPLAVNLTPTISGVIRHDSNTPLIPGDDTVDFTLTVTGTGGFSPDGWTLTSPGTLAGQGALYDAPRPFTGISIADFSAALHTLDLIIEDAANPAATATATVTAPWCSITPVVSNIVRNDNGTPLAFDDTWGYTVTVSGQFTGTGWTSDNSSLLSGAYATPVIVSGLSVATPSETITFTDNADANCIATVTVAVPRIIGTVNFGTTRSLFTDAAAVPAGWTVDESAPTQTMNNGGGAPAKVYRSEIIDLSTTGVVKFTGSLLVNDTSSGNEAADTFKAELIIITGGTTTTVNLIAPYDTIAPANGVLTGAEITPANPGPPPVTGPGDYTHSFFAVIPDTADSVQLVISGNNDTASESFTVQELLFELAGHSLEALATAGVQFDNKGTVDPADDEYRQGVTITAVLPPAGSTGWTSDSTPAAGLYTEPNPVFFGPFLQSGAAQTINLADNGVPAVTATVNFPAPIPDLITAFASNGFTLNAGGPGPEDDVATFDIMINAPVGGPEFRVFATYPAIATVSSNLLTATQTLVTVSVTRLPDHWPVNVFCSDASYPFPASWDYEFINFGNAITVGEYILAKKNFGAGLSNVVNLAGVPLPIEWQNYPALPAVGMNDSLAAAATVLSSEIIDLTGVSGPVRFTGNLHVQDLGTGLEAVDTFKAELIITDGTTTTINLIAPYDANADGVLNGGDTAANDEFNAAKLQDGNYNSDFPLTYLIPDSATSVQLVITGINDSLTENVVLENCLFSTASASNDTDGDGISNPDEAIMGTDPNDATSFTRLAQTEGLPTEFSFAGADGRFYRIYQSDDTDLPSHLATWIDTGLAASGAGSHTLNVTATPGITRRLYRVHVMQTDGPWPARTP